ncbi:ARM repeat-containing protein [Panus rudis PR-1116 ss-1]|nr:ARM repeat-containing protein [Panus rudis PR-1116 ss-1]
MTEERIEQLVRTWIATGKDEDVDATVSELVQGEKSLLLLVKSLGEYLTSEEDESRRKGMEFLSLALARFPPEKLNRQSVRVLVTFYCGKLEDTETIIPALKGLTTLVSQPAFSSTDAVEVIKAIFKHVTMKALVQSQRFLVFSIVDTLIAKHREALKTLGSEFISGYVALAEGEKDPRNLLLAFAIARVILIEFDISSHIEDLFNITFCYFPITFRPPPDDPYGITTEDLKKALRGCLNATPAFGPLAIPLFLEKLTAGTPVTKRDTLQTLDVCLPVYGPAVARENARKLWNALKLEIFQPTDPETENRALKTTQVLIQTLYAESTPSTGGKEIEGLARDACEECLRILREPEKSQATHATKVICAFMSTTPSVAQYTLSQAVPHFIKLFLNPDEVANRAPTARLLADVVAAARDASALQDPEVLPAQEDIPLAPYQDEVLGIFTVGLSNTSVCKAALDGLKALVTTKGLLSDEELGFIVHKVNEILLSQGIEDEDISSYSEGVLDLFAEISSISPRHISETTLPLLFTTLPDRAPPRSAEAERLKYWLVLAFLKKLCIQPDLFEMLVVRLSTKLDLICTPRSSESAEADGDIEPTAAYAHSILRTLADVLATKVERGHPDVQKYIDRLVPRLYHLHIYSALAVEESLAVATDHRLVAVSSEIVTLIVQTQPLQRQQQFVESLFAAYFNNQPARVAEGQPKLPAEKSFAPFDPQAPKLQRNLVPLFSAAIVALRKEVGLPVPDESATLQQLLSWSIDEAETMQQRDASFHAIASVVNKRPDDLSAFLTEQLDRFWNERAVNKDAAVDVRRKALVAWSWISKALLVRGHSNALSYVDKLFTLFDDSTVSWDAARAIGKVVSTDKVLTKKNHAVIRILYAQKFFNTVLPRIVEGAKTPGDAQRQNAYLVALTSLIKSIPKTTYTHELPTLMPLLLRGLDLPDPEIRANVIDTLLATSDSTTENKAISEHASSLVTTMLKNSMVDEMPSVRLRIAALRYLAKLPSLVRYDILHPLKATVVRELAKALDDPKKAVRKEAVEARTNWFVISCSLECISDYGHFLLCIGSSSPDEYQKGCIIYV